MIYSVLSHFDNKVGPKVVLILPEEPDYFQIEHVSFLIDFYDEGFFIHSFGEINSANFIFKLSNPLARGSTEVVMISLVFINENYNLNSFQDILSLFASSFIKLEEIYKAFYTEAEMEDAQIKYFEMLNLLEKFQNSLPKERAHFKLRQTKILIFGLPKSGITSIINRLENNIFNKDLMKEEINILKSLLGNLSILTYNLSSSSFLSKAPSLYFRDIDGLIYVHDCANTILNDVSHDLLHKLQNYPETLDLPLMILLNKSDLCTPDLNETLQILDIKSLKNKSVKVFITSAKENKGILDAFNWIASEISNNFLRDPKKVFL
ncbi:MAG: ADP-ribosylation factor-like protein [Promethearchaeota archaeon]